MLAFDCAVEESPQVSSVCVIQQPCTTKDSAALSKVLPNLCRYALTGREVKAILMQRLVKVDGKVRTDPTYPAGFMDVIEIEKTNEAFRLVYDPKGRFVPHRISKDESSYKLCKVKRQQFGKGGVPYIATHDGRTIRYPDPDIKVCQPVFGSTPTPQTCCLLLTVGLHMPFGAHMLLVVGHHMPLVHQTCTTQFRLPYSACAAVLHRPVSHCTVKAEH